jgi:hypothetical protein
MLTPYEVLRAFLLGRAEITTIVGQRVFYAQIPQSSVVPLLLISHVSSNRKHDLLMRGTDTQRISIECRSQAVTGTMGADTLGAFVIRALDGIGLPISTPSIKLIQMAGDVTLYEDSSKSIRRIIDFRCHLATDNY